MPKNERSYDWDNGRREGIVIIAKGFTEKKTSEGIESIGMAIMYLR